MSPGKLVSLRDGAADGEITLYVKGFLGRGEEPDHFERWLASHDALVRSHGWGEAARGYHWPARCASSSSEGSSSAVGFSKAILPLLCCNSISPCSRYCELKF